MMDLLIMCYEFLKTGLFAVGGGYAAMPLIMEQVVEKRAWLGMQVFADIVTIRTAAPVRTDADPYASQSAHAAVGDEENGDNLMLKQYAGNVHQGVQQFRLAIGQNGQRSAKQQLDSATAHFFNWMHHVKFLL